MYFGQFVVQTIETWLANSSAGDTPMAIKKFFSHGNSVFFSPYPLDFNVLVISSSKSFKQGHKLDCAYKAPFANMKMECKRSEILLIMGRSGIQYVAMVTKLLRIYCGAHVVESYCKQSIKIFDTDWLGYLFIIFDQNLVKCTLYDVITWLICMF